MKHVQAPDDYNITNDDYSIFLGGSIEQGTAENSQEELVDFLSAYDENDLLVLNPRRDAWNADLPQDPTPGTEFYKQVEWELEAQDICDLLIYYIDPATKSPITLLEIGAYATDNSTIVCCPKTFYRYGNIEIFCNKYNITLVHSMRELKQEILTYL